MGIMHCAVQPVPELLAQVESWDSMAAAVAAGADSILIGVTLPGRVHGAADFGDREGEVEQVINHCHLRGVRAYIALNTLISQNDLDDARRLAGLLHTWGADALVLRDLGMAAIVRAAYPELPLHASAGMTVNNSDALASLEGMGFVRAILGAELSIAQISVLCRSTSMELEAPIYSGLCAGYSGQCLIGGANGHGGAVRGRCAAPCRQDYSLVCGSDACSDLRQPGTQLLKAKHLAALPLLRELAVSGVAGITLEGASGNPEEIWAATRVYRAALDRLAEAPDDFGVIEAEVDELEAACGCDLTTGYLDRNQGADMMSVSRCGGSGVRVDRVESFGRASGVGESDRKVPISARAKAAVGHRLLLSVTDSDGNCVTTEGSIEGIAADRTPLTYDYVHKQLSRLGNTPFVLHELLCELDGRVIVPIREINEVRRTAVKSLADLRICRHRRAPIPESESAEAAARLVTGIARDGRERRDADWGADEQLTVAVRVSDLGGVHAAVDAGADWVSVGGEVFEPAQRLTAADIAEAVDAVHRERDGARLLWATPRIVSDCEIPQVREDMRRAHDAGADGAFVANLGLVGFASELYGGFVVSDWTMPVMNSVAMGELAERGVEYFLLPPGLTLDDVGVIAEATVPWKCGVMAHGALELMVSEQCVLGAVLGGRTGSNPCSAPCTKARYSLMDRTGARFPILCDLSCRMHLRNSVDLCIVEQIPRLRNMGIGSAWLDLRCCSSSLVRAVASAYVEARKAEPGGGLTLEPGV
ncbi:MAG: DUF3656 domain-containing protein [Clostridia bacterium]|nr:DUF3656 domain-containing protein [Clostridia bacterium]